MDCKDITSITLKLREDLNSWSSTVCIPSADSTECLDIMLQWERSQPHPQVQSTNLLLTLHYRELLWCIGLILCIWRELLSGCQLSIKQAKQAITTWKVLYTIACDHSRVYKNCTAINFKDDSFGPINVINQQMKHKKASGGNLKGQSDSLIFAFYLVVDIIQFIVKLLWLAYNLY